MTLRIGLLWYLFFGLVSCNSGVEEVKESTTIGGIAQSMATEARYHSFQQLTGRVGQFPIQMNLLRATAPGSVDIARYSGTYAYDHVRQPIQLSGYEQNDTLIILEPTGLESIPHEFHLVANSPMGAYEGIWINGNTGKSLPVVLQLSVSPPFQFSVRELVDSVQLYPDKVTSPRAQFSLAWLELSSDRFPKKAAFVNRMIREKILGIKAEMDLTQGVVTLRDSFFYYYREDALAFGSDDPDDRFSTMLNYDQSAYMEVIFASDSLISLSVTDYEYSGGAHGNYGTHLYVLDLAQERMLELSDVLAGNYETRLVAALGTAAREYFALDRNDPLSIVLFEDVINVTENFALTPSGILFDYPPYEIAAYAVGEIPLFVPFERLSGYLHLPFGNWR
jgi:hypothetical protein